MSVTKEIDVVQDKINWHWRNNMRVVRFGPFDARSALPLGILLFRLADWRFWLLALVNLIFFSILERRGLTTPAALRNFRSWIVGAYRPGWQSVFKKKFADYA